ncbi:MAG TPA: alpha/beta hydrolase domain-containing protein [Vicinamibacterales bacterium]|nr:alpha/beta hydrolase domain-containing protein [Vicinamibacterales bacterium]
MVLRTLLVLVLAAAPVSAEVIRIEVKSRGDLSPQPFDSAQGRPPGAVGPYERLTGLIYFAVDPRNPVNQIITDIDKAPRNAQGLVEFSSDFELLKPKDPARGNGTILYEVSNRGGRGMVNFFNRGGSERGGDEFLFAQGFTLMWIGWQFDVPLRPELLRVYAPIAKNADGSAITGLVRSDFVVIQPATEASLADRGHQAYPVSDPNDPATIMTVRDTVEGARRTVPRNQWQFTGDGKSVRMAAGFEPKKIYEVVYRAKDPAVVGAGPAAVRDTISKIKYSGATELGLPAGSIKRSIAFGISQSGRFLRTYLYYGFNEDESRRKVFDGVMPHVAGSGRGSFNHRFAQPSRDAHPFINFFYPTDIFPFTDAEQTDPVTGVTDGLLTHATKPAFQPNIFYTNSSYEYWGRSASLFHTTLDGTKDARLPANVRGYLLSGGQHGVAAFPPTRSIGQQLNNPLDYRWAMRALLVAMNKWVTDGTSPPASALPRVENGTLVTPDKMKFPKVPSVNIATVPHRAYRADYGPDFIKMGIVVNEPPKITSAFTMLVPQVDADGNEIAGIRMPELTVPVATYTGWNLFNEKSGPTNVVSSMQGSFIPLARTKAERDRSGDPRKSVEERYRGRDQYLAEITKAANDLVAKGYLLKADVPAIVEQAGTRWDFVNAARTETQR